MTYGFSRCRPHWPVQRRETTEAQRAATRANGAKSRGPVTPEGKARSSRNACRHGLSNPHLAAELTCLYVENRAEFVVIHEALADEFEPATASEALLVEEMAVCRWCLLRAWSMERALVDEERAGMHNEIELCRTNVDGALRAAAGVRQLALNHAGTLAFLERYETRLSRQFDRALRRLGDLRAHPTENFVRNEREPDEPTQEEKPNDHSSNQSMDAEQPVSAPLPTAVRPPEQPGKRDANEPERGPITAPGSAAHPAPTDHDALPRGPALADPPDSPLPR